jgi:predicted transcriptional regulator YdeE
MELKQNPGMKLVGIQVSTSMEKASEDCGAIWTPLMERRNEIQQQVRPENAYGISVMKNQSDFDYIACLEVSDHTVIPEGMVRLDLAPATYAVGIHRGTLDSLQESYSKLMEEVRIAGKQLAMHLPSIELYDQRFTMDEHSIMEIWFPIQED